MTTDELADALPGIAVYAHALGVSDDDCAAINQAATRLRELQAENTRLREALDKAHGALHPGPMPRGAAGEPMCLRSMVDGVVLYRTVMDYHYADPEHIQWCWYANHYKQATGLDAVTGEER